MLHGQVQKTLLLKLLADSDQQGNGARTATDDINLMVVGS